MDLIGNNNCSVGRQCWPFLLVLTLLAGCGGGGGSSSNGGGGVGVGTGGGSTNNVGATGTAPGASPSGSNHAPTASVTPTLSVNVGSLYSYSPLATDADGDALTYSIINRPSWAAFNSITGALSGTPNSANAGTTTGVVISVSDGKTTTAIGPFSITVTINNSGTATLSWVAPTTRKDGSPFSLSELRGYNVYEGATSTNLSPVTSITDPTATNHTVSNLATGTHFFAVTAYDTSGAESSYSNVVGKTIK